MKIHVASIINQMSPKVRSAAEKDAASKGLSLEQFIEHQMSVEITEADFRSGQAAVTESTRSDAWNIRVDHRGDKGVTRINSSINVGRF